MALTRDQKRIKRDNERAKAMEIIDRIEVILNIGTGANSTSFDSAKIDDIRNLVGRYRRGEA